MFATLMRATRHIPAFISNRVTRNLNWRNSSRLLWGTLAASVCFNWCALPAEAKAVTTTTLAVTAGGVPATTVAAGTVVTLTATVQAAGLPVTVGQVSFCDASAAHCTDIHLMGPAQLTSAGTASWPAVAACPSISIRGTGAVLTTPTVGEHAGRPVC